MKSLNCLIICFFVSWAGLAQAGVYEDILAAAENGRNDEVISLLRRGMDINTTDRDGSTLLVIAARTGNYDLTDFLLSNRANALKRNRYGDTPLHLAVSQGHIKVVERLIDGGADLNPEGWTPLHYAVFTDRKEIASLLIKRGADLDLRAPNSRTGLMLAAQLGKAELAKLLLDEEADFELKDADGFTAEDIAQQKGFLEIVALLKKVREATGTEPTVGGSSTAPAKSSGTGDNSGDKPADASGTDGNAN